MQQSESINEIITALAKAQGEILPAVKDSTNPHFKSKYADLNSIITACRIPLSKHGIALLQTMGQNDSGQLILTTMLAHSSGQWIASKCPVVAQKQDPQGIGSALTYFRRYSISSIVGISSDEDDDAERAMIRKDSAPKMTQSQGDTNLSQNKLNEIQAKELASLVSQLDESAQNSFYEYLKIQKIDDWSDIKSKDFDHYKKLVLKKLEKNKKIESIA